MKWLDVVAKNPWTNFIMNRRMEKLQRNPKVMEKR